MRSRMWAVPPNRSGVRVQAWSRCRSRWRAYPVRVTERFDLVVIGAGPAGEKAGAQAAYFGKRVAIVDRSPEPGGNAASRTGVPTKTLREAALYLTGFGRREVYGLGMELDRETVLDRMRARTAEVVATFGRGRASQHRAARDRAHPGRGAP